MSLVTVAVFGLITGAILRSELNGAAWDFGAITSGRNAIVEVPRRLITGGCGSGRASFGEFTLGVGVLVGATPTERYGAAAKCTVLAPWVLD